MAAKEHGRFSLLCFWNEVKAFLLDFMGDGEKTVVIETWHLSKADETPTQLFTKYVTVSVKM